MNELKTTNSKALYVGSKLLSYIFHPLFIPVFVTYYLLYVQPYFFIGLSHSDKIKKLIAVGINTMLFPAITVFLLWRLKFIQSIELKTQKERIIPYVATNTFFFWAYYISRNQLDNPVPFTQFLLGTFIASAAALVLNSFVKISMHAIGLAGAISFFVHLAIWSGIAIGLPISITVLLCGIVCTARLLLKEHTLFEIGLGICIGILGQVISICIL